MCIPGCILVYISQLKGIFGRELEKFEYGKIRWDENLLKWNVNLKKQV